MNRAPRTGWIVAAIAPVVGVAVLVLAWRRDWAIPLVAGRMQVAIGRTVGIAHLHVSLGRVTSITADDVRIANPDWFPGGALFATAARLRVDIDIATSIRHPRNLLVAMDRPSTVATEARDGRNNYGFDPAGVLAPNRPIGALTITDGQAHVVIPRFGMDVTATFATRQAGGSGPPGDSTRIDVVANGSHANLPLGGAFEGGLPMEAGAASPPLPIDLRPTLGPTTVTLRGAIRDLIAFTGADLQLTASGLDLGLLYPLTGLPLPETSNYALAGRLEYGKHNIHFKDVAGSVGTTDLDGSAIVDLCPNREGATFELHSRDVDLADLGGFIGAESGHAGAPNQSAQQRQALSQAAARPSVLPSKVLDLPKLCSADIDFHYRGHQFKGGTVPFDTIEAVGNLENGHRRTTWFSPGRRWRSAKSKWPAYSRRQGWRAARAGSMVRRGLTAAATL